MLKTLLKVVALSLFMAGMLTAVALAVSADGFENWSNAEIAKNWSKTISGDISGGEFNQIHSAGQGVSCGGNGINYKSVYRDIPVTAGQTYYGTVEAMSNSTNTAGNRDGSYVRMWIQFDQSDGRVISTNGTTGLNLSDRYYSEMKVEGTAPAGTHHARVILQVMGGTGGGTVFTNFNFYRKDSATAATKVAGPDFIRNTEWLNRSNIQQLWTMASEGGGPGDYVMRPTSGSSQGISVGGVKGSYREIFRTFDLADYRVEGAAKTTLTVDVTSNAKNQSGATDATLVEIYLQFLDGNDKAIGSPLKADGSQFGVGSQDAVKMKIESVKPDGAKKAQIMLRVLGGTGGGAVFDDLDLATT